MHSSSSILLLALCGVAPATFAQTAFEPPLKLTDSSTRYRLTRNPGSNAAFDSDGTLHLVYWGGGDATLPSSPSAVYYRSRSASDVWSVAEVVDDSFHDSGSGLVRFGGRQPSLAVDADNGVHVVWHDHRHSNPDPPAGGIDNIEIYADYRPFGGSFSTTDIRLTETSAGHLGDNGYLPGIAVAPSGVLSVVWHDFNADFDVSDIYVRRSDTSGNFTAVTGLGSFRLTNLSNRAGLPAYVTADIAVNPTGDTGVVWTENFGGTSAATFAIVTDPVTTASEIVASSTTAGFFDPPKLIVAPDGSFWVIYTDESGATRDVVAVRYDSSSGTFDSPVAISAEPTFDESACDAEFSSDGRLHAAWVDRRSGRHVYYAEIDLTGPVKVQETRLTTAAATWERPSLALDGSSLPHVFAEEFVNAATGDVWYFQPQTVSSVSSWGIWQ